MNKFERITQYVLVGIILAGFVVLFGAHIYRAGAHKALSESRVIRIGGEIHLRHQGKTYIHELDNNEY